MNESSADPLAFARDMKRLRKPLRLRGRWSPPLDGLWKVATHRKVHGGYLIHNGRVVRASPAVRRYIHRLARNAEYWGDPFACERTKEGGAAAGLLTRIATTESISLCVRMKSWQLLRHSNRTSGQRTDF
jgi:hypothetical protein